MTLSRNEVFGQEIKETVHFEAEDLKKVLKKLFMTEVSIVVMERCFYTKNPPIPPYTA